jgi:hypothetical protein
MPGYLSKSRFKLALECMTKLYYTGKKEEYADENNSDPFLEALAKGGFQVGELAKYYFSDNPVADNITIDTLDYEEALARTDEMLSREGRVVIAEGAFVYDNLFIRADIIVKEDDTLHLYEVKAKSVGVEMEDEKSFLNKKGDGISSDWASYLYDLAFQKYVIVNSRWGEKFKVKAHLLLANKEAVATIEGLNQKFRIIKDGNRYRVDVPDNLTRQDLGDSILRNIQFDNIIDRIWNEFLIEVPDGTNKGFREYVTLASDIYENDVQHFTAVGNKCKSCQFRTTEKTKDLKSGFRECWKNHTGYSDELLSQSLVTEIWGGGSGSISHVDNLIKNNIYLLAESREEVLAPKNPKDRKAVSGLTAHERRMEQVNRHKNGITESYFDYEGLKAEMDNWKYPLHMIDFETSMVALPFHEGYRPYQGIAFQFSHHVIHKDGSVEHKGQYLSTEQGVFPNYEFLRALRSQLIHDEGTIFRYHNHENSYLLMIADQLENDANPPDDKEELLHFIAEITRRKTGKDKEYVYGRRAMVDLYDLVVRFYFSPRAKGSNSLKKILPAIIHDSEYLRQKYGRQGVYGRNLPVLSLNFDNHVWITEETGMDPYQTLPSVFNGYSTDELDELVKDFDELGDGGAALTAYNYLQFSEVPQDQRDDIATALLRYCELDTLAMVMLVEGWRDIGENSVRKG